MNIYERTSTFFVENPKKIFLLFIFLTIGLILSYLFIPYRGDASTSPNAPIIDLDKNTVSNNNTEHWENCCFYTGIFAIVLVIGVFIVVLVHLIIQSL